MKTKTTNFFVKKRMGRVALIVGAILLIPLVLTFINPMSSMNGGNGGGWNWGPGDFVAMGVLLFGTGLAIDFAIRTLKNPKSRVMACAGIVIALLIIWVELAVDGVSKIAALLLGKPF